MIDPHVRMRQIGPLDVNDYTPPQKDMLPLFQQKQTPIIQQTADALQSKLLDEIKLIASIRQNPVFIDVFEIVWPKSQNRRHQRTMKNAVKGVFYPDDQCLVKDY